MLTAADATAARPWRGTRAWPWSAAALGIAGQIAYPLCWGTTRDVLTVLTVAAFFLAVAGACARRWGRRAALAVLGLVALTMLIEAVGVRTGFPFGRYRYTGRLGPTVAGVPIVVGLAWAALGVCAAGAGRALAPRGARLPAALIGGLALAGWDLFLDPQMVAEGHWRWTGGGPSIPGSGGIPLTNLAGWVVVGIAVAALAQRALPALNGREPILAAIFCWTYFSELLGNAAFFHRPEVAALGGVGMGAVAIPYAIQLAVARRRQ